MDAIDPHTETFLRVAHTLAVGVDSPCSHMRFPVERFNAQSPFPYAGVVVFDDVTYFHNLNGEQVQADQPMPASELY